MSDAVLWIIILTLVVFIGGPALAFLLTPIGALLGGVALLIIFSSVGES